MVLRSLVEILTVRQWVRTRRYRTIIIIITTTIMMDIHSPRKKRYFVSCYRGRCAVNFQCNIYLFVMCMNCVCLLTKTPKCVGYTYYSNKQIYPMLYFALTIICGWLENQAASLNFHFASTWAISLRSAKQYICHDFLKTPHWLSNWRTSPSCHCHLGWISGFIM